MDSHLLSEHPILKTPLDPCNSLTQHPLMLKMLLPAGRAAMHRAHNLRWCIQHPPENCEEASQMQASVYCELHKANSRFLINAPVWTAIADE